MGSSQVRFAPAYHIQINSKIHPLRSITLLVTPLQEVPNRYTRLSRRNIVSRNNLNSRVGTQPLFAASGESPRSSWSSAELWPGGDPTKEWTTRQRIMLLEGNDTTCLSALYSVTSKSKSGGCCTSNRSTLVSMKCFTLGMRSNGNNKRNSVYCHSEERCLPLGVRFPQSKQDGEEMCKTPKLGTKFLERDKICLWFPSSCIISVQSIMLLKKLFPDPCELSSGVNFILLNLNWQW